MIKSDQINQLTASLVAFQGEIKNIAFDANNPFYKSKYATLAHIIDSSRGLLNKYKLGVSQILGSDGSVTTLLIHESGEYIGDTLTLKPVKDDPQQRGSSITYARRYAYAAILGLATEQDDDGNLASSAEKVSPKVFEPVKIQLHETKSTAEMQKMVDKVDPSIDLSHGSMDVDRKSDEISEAQERRLHVLISKQHYAGLHPSMVKEYLAKTYNINSGKNIKRKDYEAICNWVINYKRPQEG